MFSPDQFLDMQVTESNDTETLQVPVGEYTAVVGEVKVRPWQSKDDPSKAGMALDLSWEIDDQGVKDYMGRDKITVKQGIMLDLTESGGLDFGKGRNANLGRLREALNLNTPGAPFAFSMLAGRVGKVSVTHRIAKDALFAEIRNVARP